MKTVVKVKESRQESLSEICALFDLKRDVYYKYIKRYEIKEEQEQKVIELVSLRRKTVPRTGCRKLHKYLQPDFGRDRLFNILRTNKMLLKPKKTSCKTTNSYHHFHKYNNLIKDFVPTKINQVWVTDITYIRTVNGFCYLALITDVFSRKIVGYDISDSLELLGVLRALKKALYKADVSELVHHSDRGVQYCSHQYTGELL